MIRPVYAKHARYDGDCQITFQIDTLVGRF